MASNWSLPSLTLRPGASAAAATPSASNKQTTAAPNMPSTSNNKSFNSMSTFNKASKMISNAQKRVAQSRRERRRKSYTAAFGDSHGGQIPAASRHALSCKMYKKRTGVSGLATGLAAALMQDTNPLHQWHPRYFVLENGVLSYYKMRQKEQQTDVSPTTETLEASSAPTSPVELTRRRSSTSSASSSPGSPTTPTTSPAAQAPSPNEEPASPATLPVLGSHSKSPDVSPRSGAGDGSGKKRRGSLGGGGEASGDQPLISSGKSVKTAGSWSMGSSRSGGKTSQDGATTTTTAEGVETVLDGQRVLLELRHSLDLRQVGVQLRASSGTKGGALGQANSGVGGISVGPSAIAGGGGSQVEDPTKYQFEVVFHNSRNPKEWLNWTICAPNAQGFHKWITAIVGAMYGTTVIDGGWPLSDSDEYEDDEDDIAVELVDAQQLDSTKLHMFESHIGDKTVAQSQGTSSPTLDENVGWRNLFALEYDVMVQIATVVVLVNAVMIMWREMNTSVHVVALLVVVNLVVVGNILLLVDVSVRRRLSRTKEDQRQSEHRHVKSGRKRRGKHHNTQHHSHNNPRTLAAPVANGASTHLNPNDTNVTALTQEEAPTKLVAGMSFPIAPGSKHGDVVDESWKPTPHSWSHWGGVIPLDVRAGPDYKRHGTKQPSLQPLFEHTAMEIFRSDKPLYDVAAHIELPKVPPVRKDSGLPTHLMFNFQVSHGNGATPYLNVMSYSTPTAEFARQAALLETGGDTSEVSNATRLTARWLRDCTTDQALKHRLKLKAVVLNMQDVGFPTMFKKYNGKPVMVTKSAKVIVNKERGYVEVDIEMDKWSFMSRMGINQVMPIVNKLDMIVSFVIQGDSNDELPEQIMFAHRISFADAAKTPIMLANHLAEM